MAKDQDQETSETFRSLINMTPTELDHWLKTKESQSVGASKTNPEKKAVKQESIGHESGRIIEQILQKKQTDLTAKDLSHMKRTIGYIKRHLGQKPSHEDLATSRWRYSLMNWGHDPLHN